MPSEMTSGDSSNTYKPISGLAVASAFCGCLSALAMLGQAFWVVPLVGIMVAAAALVDVSRQGRPRAGRLAALAGLALSVGFGMQGVSQWAVSSWLSARRATSAAELFVEAVRAGRLGEAKSMCASAALPPPTIDRSSGKPPESDVDDHDHAGHGHGDHERPAPDLLAFASMPAIARLIEAGSGPAPLLIAGEVDPSEPQSGGLHRFIVEIPVVSGGTVRVSVSVARDAGGGRFDRWIVVRHAVEPG